MSSASALIQCPDEWEYKDHPRYDPLAIKATAKKWLLEIRKETPDRRYLVCLDTRPLHKDLFENLTPELVPYFAGNYRGQRHFCLEIRTVGVGQDPCVGSPPSRVQFEMAVLSQAIEKAVKTLLFRLANPAKFAKKQVIMHVVNFIASAFVRFLTIHPYVNGNGHTSRFMLNTLFGTFDFWIVAAFPIHARPYLTYGDAISQFRDGNTTPLINLLLNCLP